MFASKDTLLTRPSGYNISRSVRLRSSASAYFNRTPASSGNRTTWTLSTWVKRGSLGGTGILIDVGGTANLSDYQMLWFSSDTIDFHQQTTTGYTARLVTTAVYRDPSAWYHIVAVWNTTSGTTTLTGTPTDRMQLWLNGVQLTSFSTTVVPASSLNSRINLNALTTIGQASSGTAFSFDGYLTEINFIDGTALTPSSFGSTNAVTGVWQPKKYGGTYGTNGFYLNFSDNSASTAATIGKDYSGNGNNWTPNNISVTAGATYDSMLDVPTVSGASSNYAVINPLLSAGGTTANGNLQVTTAIGTGHSRATIAIPTSGKWYCEFTAVSAATATDYIFGIVGIDTAEASYGYTTTPSYSYTAFGEKIVNGTFTSSFYSSFTTSDIIGCAVDLDTNQLTWYKNGVAQTAISITTGSYFWMVSDASGSRQITAAFNAGQRPFTYTPPSGFVALNTQNLSTPTIANGAAYMAATTYTGDGTANRVISGLSFTPDFIWIKNRSSTWDNILGNYIATSGSGTPITLVSNSTAAEVDGGYIGTQTTNSLKLAVSAGENRTNGNTLTYVAWQWNAGGSTVTNTSGTISAQVRANPTAGFSVVTYTGVGGLSTVGHGLGVAPSMVIVMPRSFVSDKYVYHASIGAANFLSINLTSASAATALWNSTSPTSTVFTVNGNGANQSTSTFVAYCFAAVAGYSAFGSYTGNGSADGTFVYLGFRPRFILIKASSAIADWDIFDSSRDTSNTGQYYLFPNTSGAEQTLPRFDLLSNGIKLRTTGDPNNSSVTYIYAAFAENPFKYSLAR